MTWTELAAEARRHDASMAQGEWSEWEFPDDTDANYRGIAFARNNLARFAEACEKAAGYDALDAERDAWKNAVIDAAVVNWTYTIADDADPRKAVNALICHAIDQDRDRLREENTRLAAEVARLKQGPRIIDAVGEVYVRKSYCDALEEEVAELRQPIETTPKEGQILAPVQPPEPPVDACPGPQRKDGQP